MQTLLPIGTLTESITGAIIRSLIGRLSIVSDPTKKDTDDDTFDDNEDAIPLLKNPDRIYVFALQEFADQGKRLKSAYIESGLNVSLDTFNDTETL